MAEKSSYTVVPKAEIYALHSKLFDKKYRENNDLKQAYRGLHDLKTVASKFSVDIIVLIEYLETRKQLMIL